MHLLNRQCKLAVIVPQHPVKKVKSYELHELKSLTVKAKQPSSQGRHSRTSTIITIAIMVRQVLLARMTALNRQQASQLHRMEIIVIKLVAEESEVKVLLKIIGHPSNLRIKPSHNQPNRSRVQQQQHLAAIKREQEQQENSNRLHQAKIHHQNSHHSAGNYYFYSTMVSQM